MGILLHDIELPNETEGTMVIKIKPGAEKADIQWHAFVGGILTEDEEVSDRVHGKWTVIPKRCENQTFDECKCSVCGEVEYFNSGWKKFSYCPYCGAMMDKETEHETK